MKLETTKSKQAAITPFWRDKRVIPILLQIIFAIVVIGVVYYFISNALKGLNSMGLPLGFGFLQSTASFEIQEKIIGYSATDSYGRAILVGLLNTLKVAVLGIILASLLGFIIGLSRLSNNWLARNVSKAYVEFFRNTPLLVQMVIWASVVFLSMPLIADSYVFFGSFYISNRGVAIPWFNQTAATSVWAIFLVIGLIGAIVLWKIKINQQILTGIRKYPAYWAIGSVAVSLAAAWLFTQQMPLNLSVPAIHESGRNYVGGYRITPEFGALLIALVTYTAAFIAEIVRAGIMAVNKGQVEAASSLGIKGSTAMRHIILPQAVRIIVPPVTNQYLNLTKNSSLAVAIGYPDIVRVGNTILNQSGRAIEMITIMILVFLTISLITSLIMNIFNKYTQIVER